MTQVFTGFVSVSGSFSIGRRAAWILNPICGGCRGHFRYRPGLVDRERMLSGEKDLFEYALWLSWMWILMQIHTSLHLNQIGLYIRKFFHKEDICLNDKTKNESKNKKNIKIRSNFRHTWRRKTQIEPLFIVLTFLLCLFSYFLKLDAVVRRREVHRTSSLL